MERTTNLSTEACVRLDVAASGWLSAAPARAVPPLEATPKRWLPCGLSAAGGGKVSGLPVAPPPAELRPLLFDEAEVARLVAAVDRAAAERARAECAGTVETQRSLSVARAADALAAALTAHRDDEAASLGHVVELAEAVARALTADSRTPAELGVMIRSMLATVAAAPSVRIFTCPDDEAAVHALLPEVVAASGFTGKVEIVGEPRLPGGAVQLVWADGWLEHAPASIWSRIDAVLAPYRCVPAPPGAPSCVTTNGDEDAGE